VYNPRRAITDKGIIQRWYYIGHNIEDVPDAYLEWAMDNMDQEDEDEAIFMDWAKKVLERRYDLHA
jgi:site-specific recombinase XerD